jgi:lipoprotein-releasing system permease protein
LISSAELLIIKNYISSKKKDSFLKIISLFSFLGIAIGVATLIIVMSVMNGFRAELFDKLLKFNSHITVKSYTKDDVNVSKINQYFVDHKLELKSIKKTISSQGLLVTHGRNTGILVVGISKEDLSKEDFAKNILGLNNFKNGSIIVGQSLSNKYGLQPNEVLNILSSNNVSTPFGNIPQQSNFKIAGTFNSGVSELDYNYAFITFDDAFNFVNKKKDFLAVDIKLKDFSKADIYKKELENNFQNYFFTTWIDNNQTFFDALLVERNVMFIILTLIIIVAAFNIISGMTILVKNKTKDVAIFNTLGFSKFSIAKIFFIIGSFIGVIGTIFGVILGIVFAHYIENIRLFFSKLFHVQIFPPEIYFLTKLPSLIDYKLILIISSFSILITFLASLYPTITASKLNPIRGLKHD